MERKTLYGILGGIGGALVLAGAIGYYTSHRHPGPLPLYSMPVQRAVTNEDDKAVFHSTMPVFSNPDRTFEGDGTSEGYRPLREGENLGDVLKEGPTTRYDPKHPENTDPKNQNRNYDNKKDNDINQINPNDKKC